MAQWMISVRTHTGRRDFLFSKKEGETNLDVYKRAKAEAAKIKAKFGDKPVVIDIVSRAQAFKKPDGYKVPRNHMWCPYCIKPRLFHDDDYLDVRRCPVCGISDHDYYVKYYNGIFLAEHLEMLQEAKVRKA